ncbi:MAG TPA: hypothetical protein VI357_19505 [Mycobacteriales bacterium]
MRRVRLLLIIPAAALAVTACGSSSTAGSGAPAGATAVSTAASTPAATTSAAPADNGVSALSAEQILAKAKSALGAADAVRIAGSGTDGGTAVKLDMRYGADGAVGTFIIDGQRLDLLRVSDDVYVKGSTSFWTTFANASVAKLLGGKYVKTTATDARFKDLADFTDLSSSVDGFLEPDGAISKGGTATIAGQPAIGLVSKGATGGTLYVATTGRPYPLSIDGKDNKLTFTDYGKAVTVKAPPAAQIVDADTLPGS